MALVENTEAFVVYIASFNLSKSKILIYPTYKVLIALLIAEKIIVLTKYSDFTIVFLKKLAIKPFEHFKINKHSIGPKPAK